MGMNVLIFEFLFQYHFDTISLSDISTY